MKRIKSHFQEKEPAFESPFQTLRFNKIIPFVKKNAKVMDLGCGFKASFLKKVSPDISEGIGYDISVTNQKVAENIRLYSKRLDGDLKLPKNHFDLVISLAVIEHLKRPQVMVDQVYKTLKKGGCFILTTPSPIAKPILEFLSYKLHIVSEQEIRDHKKYYNQSDLLQLLIKAGFKKNNIKIKIFELGFNTFAISKK